MPKPVFETECEPYESSDCETCGSDWPSLEYTEHRDGTFELQGRWGCYGGAHFGDRDYAGAIAELDYILGSKFVADVEGVTQIRERLVALHNG